MKRHIILILLITQTLCSFSQVLRERIKKRMAARIEKNAAAHSAKGVAPDYADLYYWAAHPWKHDYSDSIPAFLKGEQRDTSVDVFFLYPTSFTGDFKNAAMNADVNDTTLNQNTDKRIILNQATIFNGSARVFAPRYRQAHLKAFFDAEGPASKQAFDLAYNDLKTAFQYYLDHWNKGRPIIITGHSQGSMHAVRLLQEFFDGTPLQKQLVCAYIPGWRVKATDLKQIPLGVRPDQTNCVLTWRTYKKDKIDLIASAPGNDALCVNPISWTTGNAWTTPEMHKGAIGKNFNVLLAHKVTAAINKDYPILWVDGTAEEPGDNKEALSSFAKMGNLHILDFNLFYMDVRENAKLRIKSYFRNH